MKFIVKSLRVEKYIGKSIEGHNCDFNYYSEEKVRYILNCETGTGYALQKWELVLWDEDGECGSGWCSASWGHGEIKKVENFVGITHKPIKELSFDFNIDKDDNELPDINNDIFSIDYDGGDSYYPSGYASVEMELFEEIIRNKEKIPVWIFSGDSCLGKTYLAQIISNSGYHKEVYETDSNETLPDEITADIIVLGNKYSFTIEEIDKRIKLEHELIKVEFSK